MLASYLVDESHPENGHIFLFYPRLSAKIRVLFCLNGGVYAKYALV